MAHNNEYYCIEIKNMKTVGLDDGQRAFYGHWPWFVATFVNLKLP
jgi:hypothetical protein